MKYMNDDKKEVKRPIIDGEKNKKNLMLFFQESKGKKVKKK